MGRTGQEAQLSSGFAERLPSALRAPPSPRRLASEILADWSGLSEEARLCIEAFGRCDRIEDEESYRIAAKARACLAQWRSKVARQVKRDLETLLAHYRAEHW